MLAGIFLTQYRRYLQTLLNGQVFGLAEDILLAAARSSSFVSSNFDMDWFCGGHTSTVRLGLVAHRLNIFALLAGRFRRLIPRSTSTRESLRARRYNGHGLNAAIQLRNHDHVLAYGRPCVRLRP